jgi:hypothetical protein
MASTSKLLSAISWLSAAELVAAYLSPALWFYALGPAVGVVLLLLYLRRLFEERRREQVAVAAAAAHDERLSRQRNCVNGFLYDAGARADEFCIFLDNEALPHEKRQPSSLVGADLQQAVSHWRFVVGSFLQMAFSSGEEHLFQALGERVAAGRPRPENEFMHIQRDRLNDLIRRSGTLPIRPEFDPEPWESTGSLDGPLFLREPWRQQ